MTKGTLIDILAAIVLFVIVVSIGYIFHFLYQAGKQHTAELHAKYDTYIISNKHGYVTSSNTITYPNSNCIQFISDSRPVTVCGTYTIRPY